VHRVQHDVAVYKYNVHTYYIIYIYVCIYIYSDMLPLCLNRGCTKCLCHIGHGTLSSERGAKGALWRCIWCFGGKVVSQELRHSSRTDWQKLDQSVEKWGKWLKLAEICKTEARSWYFVSCFVLECWELDALLLKLQHSYRGWHCLVTSAQSLRWSSGHIWCWLLFLRSRHQNTLC
jgi:hypothetical protein